MDALMDVSVCVQPRPQQRPRWCKRTGLAHDPSARDKKLFMQCLEVAADEQGVVLPDAIERGKAVALRIEYVFERPKSHYKGSNKDKQWRLAKTAPVHMVRKPDLDNLVKLTMGAYTPMNRYLFQATNTRARP